MTEPFPARLHVLLARTAPVGLVIRRGPSRATCSLLWDRRSDTFQLGQWLRGRIYERRCDLSPDGKHWIYFAMNGHWDGEAKGSWTAVARAPYLKALVMLPKGDCWHGGGLFTADRRYWLNGCHGYPALHDTTEVRRDDKANPSGRYGGECLSVYYPRLLRDGWRMTATTHVGHWNDYHIFEKPAGAGWTLRKLAHSQVGPPPGKGCYWDEHQLLQSSTGATLAFPDWEWADLDGERLVWAQDGKLFAAQVTEGGLVEERLLHDFNAMTFEAIPAPY